MVGECVQAAPRALSVGELLRERFSGALHMRAMPVMGRPRSALREESLLERQHGEGFRREVAGQEVHARHRPFRRRQMGPAAYALVRWRAGRIAFRPLRAFLQRGGGACETVQPGSESHRLRLRELHRSAAPDARRGGHGNHLRAAQLLPLRRRGVRELPQAVGWLGEDGRDAHGVPSELHAGMRQPSERHGAAHPAGLRLRLHQRHVRLPAGFAHGRLVCAGDAPLRDDARHARSAARLREGARGHALRLRQGGGGRQPLLRHG